MQAGTGDVAGMYFIISKIAGFVLLPSNAIGLIAGLGLLLLLIRRPRAAWRAFRIGAALLIVCGFSPLGHVLMLPLTERFPVWHAASGAPDGIIVLGGSIDADATALRGMLETEGSAERLFAMLDLARRYPKARILFAGGSGNLTGSRRGEAPVAGQLLDEFGLSNDRVVLESESRTTEENAAFARRLVMPVAGERWLLVTSAFHMPRSVGLFRAAGFEVEAYPVDFRTRGWIDAASPSSNVVQGLARTDTAVHEWIGLVASWAAGRSRDLFPGPQRDPRG